MDNRNIADRLRQYARELDTEGGNLYRVRAYRRAAEAIIDFEIPLATVLRRGGRRRLQELPGIGAHIAKAIESLIQTGKMPARVRTPMACL
jgi:DNA polymerase (family 10)